MGGWTIRPARPMLDRMIDVDHLTKRYGRQLAVDDISFRCEPGTVTGFLGPNGAGKSTTLRMICGLTPPNAGTATVLDRPYRKLHNPGREVGVLLDASAQHCGRTGREVLALSAVVLGVHRPASTSCSTSSGSRSRRRASASATTRSACASGWASPTPCSATPAC